MSKEIIINSTKDQTQIALLEDRELVELYFDTPENTRTIGNIYLGRVRKLMPNIQACFIDIGQKQDAFLHFSDIADNLPELLAHLGEQVPQLEQSPIKVMPESLHQGLDEDFELDEEAGEEETSANPRQKQNKRPSRPQKNPQVKDGANTDRQPSDRQNADRQPSDRQPSDRQNADRRNQERTPNDRNADRNTNGKPVAQKPNGDRQNPDRQNAPAKPQPTADTSARKPNEASPNSANERDESEDKGVQEVVQGGIQEEKRAPQANNRQRQNKPEARSAPPVVVGSEDAEAISEAPAAPRANKRKRPPRRKKEPSSAPNADQNADLGEHAIPAEMLIAPLEDIQITSIANDSEAEVKEQKPKPKSNPNRSRSRRPKAKVEGAGEENQQTSAPKTSEPRGDQSKPDGNDKVVMATVKESPAPKAFKRAETVHPAHYLREGQRILVKISKEPISNKGSRVTTDISLAGRFLVLVPYTNYVAVSKKIASQKERKRLRVLAASLLPQGFGVIVRTVAEDRDAKSLYTDLKLLLDKWAKIEEQLTKKPNPPSLLYQDVSMASSVIRDLFTEDYDRILIDDSRIHRNIKSYVQAVAPQMATAVKLYTEKKPIFEYVGVQNALQDAFAKRVNMPSGGYLFIEHTEAMHVIDVNSGRAGYGMTQEENSVNINLEAVHHIARHLRLRDLGGIIVVDFIDLRNESNRKKVWQAMRREFRKDRAVTKLLPMSDFGLMEITRQRLRPSAMANGDGRANDADMPFNISITELVRRMEGWLEVFKAQSKNTAVKLRVHPFTVQYLNKGLIPKTMIWRFKKKVRVQIEQDERVDPLQFQFVDVTSGEDITREYDWNI
jgi:ribonuclease G